MCPWKVDKSSTEDKIDTVGIYINIIFGAELFFFFFLFFLGGSFFLCLDTTPQWGAADAEIKVPSVENTELKRSPFKAWSESVYSHTCYAHCQGFFPCLFLPFWSIHLHFFQNLSQFLLCWLWLTHGSCVGPQNKKVTLPDAGSRVECLRNVNTWLVKWITCR